MYYPERLHMRDREFPLIVDQETPSFDDLSTYQKSAWTILGDGAGYKPSSKLMGSFKEKHRYGVHLANLQFYMSRGIELRKIYRIVRFHQESYIKVFINLCTSLRARAASPFEEKQTKLVSNSNYGESYRFRTIPILFFVIKANYWNVCANT